MRFETMRFERLPAALAVLALAGAGLATCPAAAPPPAQPPQGDETPGAVGGPGPKAPDLFHPDRAEPARPLYGGRVIVHLPSLPKSICYPIENSSETRRILYQVHETLLIQDWEYHDFRPNAAESFVVEDLVVLKEAAHGKYAGETPVRVVSRDGSELHRWVRAVYGEAVLEDGAWRVTPASHASDLPEPVTIAEEDVDVVECGAVFTLKLRSGVRWHPSIVHAADAAAVERIGEQFLDPADVRFSWAIYSNPGVDCDEKRFQYQKITDCRIVDDLSVRFFYQEQNAFATQTIGTSLTLLPAHLYDLSDPDNPAYDPDASPAKQAEHVNLNPHNRLWVGIGPYRITQWTQQHVQAERFTDAQGKALYFDRETRPGYVDVIRWRYIDDDKAAMTALLNGDLDFFDRVKTEDYFGATTTDELFTKSFYKGYRYLGQYGYHGWNLYRPQLADRAVRIAIAHAFDFDAYLASNYKGLARQVTGPVPYDSEGYAHDVVPFPHDVAKAEEILEDAGWYDRDGDGIRDKDGVALSIEFLFPTGNDASERFGLVLQETLREIGIELRMVKLEWATLLDRVKNREFDSINLAWVPPLESDPQQLWHSKQGARGVRSSNNAGVQDPRVDELIGQIQSELDHGKRMELWKEFHRYLYREVQPYLFLFNPPLKYAMSRRIRGFQAFLIDPGYSIRGWYFSDPSEPGVRRTLDR